MDKIISDIQKDLKHKLNPARYEHTIAVMYTAASLAMKHSCNIQKTMLAAVLHDSAKCIPIDKVLQLCEKYNIEVNETEHKSPYLLHAKLGAFIAAKKYHINDKEIITAILNHTTGRPHMSLIEKIIFVADYIEPNRTKAKNLAEIRICAFENLNKAVAMIMHDTLNYLNTIESPIDPMTQFAYDNYKTYL